MNVATPELVNQLRDALIALRRKMLEQHMQILQLTSEPLPYATVLGVDIKEHDPKVFEPGLQVIVVAESEYHGAFGTLLESPDEDGYASVELDDGETESYLVTHPLPFLTLVNDPEERNASAFKIGDKVKLMRTARKGKFGIVVQEANPEGKVIVTLSDGSTDFYPANYPTDLELEVVPVIPPRSTAVVAYNGLRIEVGLPRNLEEKVQPGFLVKLSMQTMQIVAVAELGGVGEIVVVLKVLDSTMSEVEQEGTQQVVFNGKFANDLKDGDRVVLDPSGSVIVSNLGQQDKTFTFTEETGVSWDDIGGLEEAKRQLREAIELPVRYPEVYQFYGKKPIKGIMLFGPPGCGKTMLAKASATSLAQLHGASNLLTGLIYIKGPEILSRYVGDSEATIRNIFSRARMHMEKHGWPALIFIDEAESILSKRGTGISSDIEKTIVPMFLAEMDGLQASGAVVMLATNRPDILDPAVIRDGRIDRKILVSRPSKEDAKAIFELHLRDVPLYNGYSSNQVAERGSVELYSSQRTLYKVMLDKGECFDITLGDITNGSMIAGIVDQATSISMMRDLESKNYPQGMRQEDMITAVEAVFAQNAHLNHDDEIGGYIYDFRERVTDIRKVRHTAASR